MRMRRTSTSRWSKPGPSTSSSATPRGSRMNGRLGATPCTISRRGCSRRKSKAAVRNAEQGRALAPARRSRRTRSGLQMPSSRRLTIGSRRGARQSHTDRLQRFGTSLFFLRKASPMLRCFSLAVVFGFLTIATFPAPSDEPKPLKILFLGDDGHHKPMERFRQLQPVMAKRGIDLQYTDKVDALNPKTLADYDGLLIYAN